MDDLKITNIEQHIQRFHSSLRTDYLGKVNEVAKLHAEMAKLQTRLLDVEHENHMLKMQLELSKAKGKHTEHLPGPPRAPSPLLPAASAVGNETPIDCIQIAEPSEESNSFLKRARSPLIEIIENSKPSRKRVKVEAKLDIPASTQVFTHTVKTDTKCEVQSPRRTIFKAKSCSPELGTSSSSSAATIIPALQDTKDTKVKRQKTENPNVFSLPQSVTDTYLQNAETFEIQPPPLDLEVPRKFLRITYGGSDQHFLQYIQADRNPSGPYLRRVVYPMLDLNPSMPSLPGEPGLVFASRHELLSNPPWTLFCKRVKDKAIWSYLGEYECTLVGSMTANDFQAQSSVVQREWARRLLKQKSIEVYVSMRARIALRFSSMIPASNKDEEDRLVKREVEAIKANKGRRISEQNIIDAFCRGDEGIDIILMTCVKYDHVFADDIQTQFANPPSETGPSTNMEKKASGAKPLRMPKPKRSQSTSRQSSAISSPTPAEVAHGPATGGYVRSNRLKRSTRKVIESTTSSEVSGSSAEESEWSAD
ncbi:hypothetical protein BDN70DRAFT_992137 [Pholiota conissans]|uniref:DUF6697 domain-containing protein n=1 Tax=Pholiota conissans TaxID=109636 RepID=A0A9P6CVT7_9AGAR|nr:hypothetical protein BDN70DRAFT_992137 [Pholiota conissans]